MINSTYDKYTEFVSVYMSLAVFFSVIISAYTSVFCLSICIS